MTRAPSGRQATGSRGAVAAGHPVASFAALRALDAGGNALDACLAATAVSWMAMPDMSGPGGDLFALIREPSGEVRALNGAGYAPAEQPEGSGAGAGKRQTLTLVPGLPSAFNLLSRDFGRLPLADILAPAIALAETGAPIGQRLLRQLEALPRGRFRDELSASWQQAPFRLNAVVRWPALARSLAEWAQSGTLERPLGDSIPAWRERGARLALADIEGHGCAIEDPLKLNFGAWTIYAQPPLSQSVATLRALAVAGPDAVFHADGVYREHMFIEAYKTTYGHLKGLGEGCEAAAFCREMLDPKSCKAAREGIGPQAGQGPPMIRNYGETTQVAAVDAEGRTVTLIQSLYRPFGARILAPETGLIGNDRGASFTEGVNAPGPRRRPRHTLSNIVACHADGMVFAMGTPGAEAQTQTNLQVLGRILRDPADPLGAVQAPRWSFLGGDNLAIEADMPDAVTRALGKRKHLLALRPARDWLMGSVSLAGFDGSACTAVADDRREALALAF
ncbi:MAG: gamma-glutamyltransferase [Alphaproteobacteria bacterium]